MKKTKITIVSSLLLCAVAVTSCSSKSEERKEEEEYLASYPEADIEVFRLLHDEEALHNLIEKNPYFQDTFMMKQSSSDLSAYNNDWVVPIVDWSQLKIQYYDDEDILSKDLVLLLGDKQNTFVRQLIDMVGDEVELDYSNELYAEIDDYVPDFSSEDYGRSASYIIDIDLFTYDEILDVVLENWREEITYGGRTNKELKEVFIEGEIFSKSEICSYPVVPQDYEYFIYEQLIQQYPERFETYEFQNKITNELNNIYNQQINVIIEAVPEEVLTEAFNNIAQNKEFDFDKYSVEDVLEYYFESWCNENNFNGSDENYNLIDFNNDGVDELVIITSVPAGENFYKNSVSVFEIKGGDIQLTAYFNEYDSVKSIGGAAEGKDAQGKTALFIQFENSSMVEYDGLEFAVWNTGYDVLLKDSDYTLTQGFANEFKFETTGYKTDWLYYIENSEINENVYGQATTYFDDWNFSN